MKQNMKILSKRELQEIYNNGVIYMVDKIKDKIVKRCSKRIII